MRRSSSVSKIPRISTVGAKSSIPLRRSNSSSNLQVGGIPIGPSGSSRPTNTFRRSNSSSNLQVPGAFRRSNSNSNLLASASRNRDRLRTPQTANRPSTISKYQSASSQNLYKKDARPLSDKKWQGDSFDKVRRFVHERNPNTGTLRPPNLNTFILVMNIFFKEIDNRITITKENYKEQVPIILKSLWYPGTITQSLFKTINAMHSWPQILGIWVWLEELIQELHNPEKIIHKPEYSDEKIMLYKILNKFLTASYLSWSEKSSLTKLENEFSDLKQVNKLPIEKLQAEVQKLQEQYDNINKTKEDNLHEINKNKMAIEKLKGVIKSYTEKKLEFKTKIQMKKDAISKKNKELDVEIVNLTDALQTLRTKISVQSCTVEEKQQLLRDVEDMKYQIQLKKERKQEVSALFESFDFKLNEARQKLVAEIYRKNNVFRKYALVKPEINLLLIRESGFLRNDMLQEVHKIEAVKVEIENKLLEEHRKNENSIKHLKKVLLEKEERIENTLKDINHLQQQISDYNNAIRELERTYKEEISKEQAKKTDLEKNLQEVQSKMMDFSVYQKEYQDVLAKSLETKKKLTTFQESSVLFFHEMLKGPIISTHTKYQEKLDALVGLTKVYTTAAAEISKTTEKVLRDCLPSS